MPDIEFALQKLYNTTLITSNSNNHRSTQGKPAKKDSKVYFRTKN